MFDYDVCDNYTFTNDIRDLDIGYAKKSGPLFIIIPSIAIVFNLGILFTFYKRSERTRINQ
jgi:hypothetical protein